MRGSWATYLNPSRSWPLPRPVGSVGRSAALSMETSE